jgi:S1-C subfamily serine protease
VPDITGRVQQGDVIRAGAWVAVAGAGAGLALAGAALTGKLGSSTTFEQITPTSPAASTLATPGRGLSVQEIFRLDAPGVVRISDSTGPAPAVVHQSLGSGFVIDKAGHIVTSNLVVSGARALKVSFSGSDEVDASIIGHDPTTDVAVLQVDAHSRSLSPLPLGDSDLVQVGDPIVAIGNSGNLDRTATVGIVSGVQHGIDTADPAAGAHAIQTDATVEHSGSGGPVINTLGQVIGVSSRAGTVMPGMGLAIPIDTVKSVVAQLLETGTVQHVYLGVQAAPLSESIARSYALPCNYGLIVQAVTPGSGAAVAGLRAGHTSVVVAGESYLIGGDIIVAANGRPVTTDSQLRNVVQAMKPGDTLALQIWRGDRKETVHVKLGQPPTPR